MITIIVSQWVASHRVGQTLANLAAANSDLTESNQQLKIAKDDAERNYDIALDAVRSFYNRFRSEILQAQPELDDDINWTWAKSVNVYRELIENRTNDRDLTFEGARIMGEYANYASQRIHADVDSDSQCDRAWPDALWRRFVVSKQWLEADPERAGTLYVDGHVRLYHGKQTELPRRYVSRQRLCLRGTTDYWVNDALGLPFFAVERPVDHGMLEALKSDIVPCLLADVPNQPTPNELDEDPYRCRFVLVFDREGYSPAFFQEMWQAHRVACITYHKFPTEAWPEEEFTDTLVTLPNGETVVLKLAERGSRVGDKRLGLWVREVGCSSGSSLRTPDLQPEEIRSIDGRAFSAFTPPEFQQKIHATPFPQTTRSSPPTPYFGLSSIAVGFRGFAN